MAVRALTDAERSLLEFLLSKQFEGRDALLRQAQTVKTTGSSCSCGCPSFSLVPDRTLAAAPEVDTVPSDAHGLDPIVEVLLFVRDGYLVDVELITHGDNLVFPLPDPADLRINEWSEPDENGGRYVLNP